MNNLFNFGLQLFAEPAPAEPAPQADPTPEDNPQAGQQLPTNDNPKPADNQPTDPNKKTILGGQQPEVYDIKSVLPEGYELDQEQYGKFESMAKEYGLKNEQFQNLAKLGLDVAQRSADSVTEGLIERINIWGEDAKKELGAEFDSTIGLAGAGIEALAKTIPNIRQVLNETGAGNRVEIIRAMAMLGKLTREDVFKGFGATAPEAKSIYEKTDFSKY